MLAALSDLGAALGYRASDEHPVGPGTAAVDMAWLASSSDGPPLFIFEVETTPSAGLASNAVKVFGTPLDELAKPLFFFHVVLSGRPDNDRIRHVERAWGSHNYRVYRFADPNERAALIRDVLLHHRRVNNHASPLAVAQTLQAHGWGTQDFVADVLTHLERLQFCASYLYDYAHLAIIDHRYLDLFASTVRTLDERLYSNGRLSRPDDEERHDCEGYRQMPGDYIPGLLENAVRIYAGDVADADGPAVFERWARRTGTFRMIDAAFGLSRDYDSFVLITAPLHYACAATLLASHPRSRDWLLEDLLNLLNKERERGVLPTYRRPTIIWLAHLLSASGKMSEQVSRGSGVDSELDIDRLYQDLALHAEEGGGVPAQLLLSPPTGWGSLFEEGLDWVSDDDLVPLPGRKMLHDLATHDRAKDEITAEPDQDADRTEDARDIDMLSTCLGALASYDSYKMPTQRLVEAIHRT